jgi:FKBP-type peptidyl-prolyl cis-trans isomerase FklB
MRGEFELLFRGGSVWLLAPMRMLFSFTLGLLLLLTWQGCQKSSEKESSMSKKTPSSQETQDKISYMIGLNIGQGMKQDQIEVNPGALAEGLRDALADKPKYKPEEIQVTMQAFQQEMQAKAQKAAQGVEEANLKEGMAFLETNKSQEGIKTTASGLQYKVLTSGKAKGKSPKLTDTISANYRGTLINGTEFDSSYKRGQPATFPVNGVIPGWTEILQMMKEGDKWQVFIPPALAYGARGAGRDIPPQSTLIFEIELIAIK